MQDLIKNDIMSQSENNWMVQCLSLATIGMLAYMHIAPAVMAAS